MNCSCWFSSGNAKKAGIIWRRFLAHLVGLSISVASPPLIFPETETRVAQAFLVVNVVVVADNVVYSFQSNIKTNQTRLKSLNIYKCSRSEENIYMYSP